MPGPSKTKLLSTIKELNDQKFALDQAAIVAVTDASGKITYVNDKFIAISKYTRSELIGADHRLVNSGHHPPTFFRDMWRTISAGEVWNGEIKNRAKDGSYYWVHTTIVPFLNDKGQPYQYTAIRKDITETVAMREQLAEKQTRLLHAEKMASLGEMAAGIAHELGNPIAAITSWLSVVTSSAHDGTLDQIDLTSTIDIVNERAQDMQKIINSLLSYARDGSKDPLTMVDLCGVVDKTLTYCSKRLRDQKLTIRNLSANRQVFCNGRESELTQVLVNLLTNAGDALANTENPWVEIDVEAIADRIDLTVTDSGPGVPREITGRIFDPFFTTKPAGKGTGLGLSVVSNIVKDHGGTLSVDKTSPHTRFVVSLPSANA
jgi:PAS domain S-box-containing protein